ncbi:hypothetical protein CVT24_012583 [Panaeolus cyanescens]|uniref:Cytochrome P450 n=1 Tax=Panaeolus cyanescens TaxID=181874 RepID=A0A409YJV5_9AGAR|nr:hypothetical protein CVT24_012583 [Panaeolus cyanescens]
MALDALALTGLAYTAYVYATRRSRRHPYPPGPKGLPIIGNILDMPKEREWEVYHQMCKELDTDILHLCVAGTHIVVLDTYEVASDLLEKRSTIYSGRPRLPMVVELMGWDYNFGFMDYGDRWRAHRRLMHNSFHPTAALKFRPHELEASRVLVKRIYEEPDDLLESLRIFSGEIIMSSTYGLSISSKSSKYINLSREAIDPVVPALVPGTYLVDVIPALKYVPDWFPGAKFKRIARENRKMAMKVREVPFADTKSEIATGVARLSFCRTSLEMARTLEAEQMLEREELIKNVAGTLYGAGADSTMATVGTCILALLNHPEVLRKAHEELDRVLKQGALPDFEDMENLPYITAIVKESMRWRDTAPLGLPHVSQVDDVYKGYRIPKGSIVIPNAWAMLHDEDIYADPLSFKPERFLKRVETKDGIRYELDKSVRDPSFAIWGFGRRICPGRYMAASAIWMAVASLLAAFDFTQFEDGSPDLNHPYMPGGLRVPKPFKCKIRPRSPEIERSIQSIDADLGIL